jgi:hypothetical protein
MPLLFVSEGNMPFLFDAPLAHVIDFLDGLENQTFLSAQEKEPLYVCRPLLQRSESGKRQYLTT